MPEIIVTSGDIFESGCAALVNPVDAVTGAQGKGLALEFKKRWPGRAAWYKERALSGMVLPGGVEVSFGDPIIMFAATKRHWRGTTNTTWIWSCLGDLEALVSEHRIRSIAIPAMGCGLGRADWAAVKPMILDSAERMTCDIVKVYEPR